MGYTFARKLGEGEVIGKEFGQQPQQLIAQFGGLRWRIDAAIQDRQALQRVLGHGIAETTAFTHIAECELPTSVTSLQIRKMFNLRFQEVMFRGGEEELVAESA